MVQSPCLIPMRQFRRELAATMEQLRMEPEFAILDETDSGLDADAVRLASLSIAKIGGHRMGILIITHHGQLLEHNRPDFTHVIVDGRIVKTGGPELAADARGSFGSIRVPPEPGTAVC